jgi:hypothetical protein
LTISKHTAQSRYFWDQRAEALWPRAVIYSALGLLGAAAALAVILQGPDVRLVIMPAVVCLWVFTIFATILYFRDAEVPIFHAGFFAAATALVYIALPAMFFALSGFQWSETSDPRLRRLGIGPEDVSGYAWRGALYLFAFCATYVSIVRTRVKPARTILVPVATADAAACVLIIVAGVLYGTAVEFAFGVSISEKNAAFPADGFDARLPLVVAQLTHNVMAITRIAKLALVVALLGLFKKQWAIFGLIVFLLIELVQTLALLGPRTYFATLVLAALLAFHRMVRPLSVPTLGIFAVLFLFLLVAYGNFRNFTDVFIDFSTMDEFQTLMGTALHVRDMVARGLQAPPQVLWSELLMLIPQQLLPIEKVDPSIWYLIESGFSEDGSGYMFGVQSQAEVGWGNIELLVRGIVLAVVLGVLHRQYSKRSASFIVTVAYIWLLTTIYYSYRAATFYWLTFVTFRLLVFVALFFALRRLLSMSNGAMDNR